MREEDAPTSSVITPPVVGARVIIEVLRHASGIPPESVQLTPQRNKAAQFVLEKSLQKLEKQYAQVCFPSPIKSIAATIHRFAKDETKIIYMAQADWGAAKLLDQIFDAVIDGGKIDIEGVWLLNRFRLPIFHFVLNDYSFFFAKQNIARRFLNTVTLHLLTTKEPFARDIKLVVGGIATRMLESFDGNTGKFNSLCLEAQTWFAIQQQRIQKSEIKIREFAESQTKKQVADERVIALINRCIAGKYLPKLLIEFMTGEWRRSLLLTSMKEGEQSVNWKRQARLSESLVEFALACNTEAGRAEYQNFLPSLVKGVNAALVSVHSESEILHEAMEPLELVLNALMVGASPEMQTCEPLPLPKTKVTEYQVKVESDIALKRIQELQVGQWVRFKTSDHKFEACTLVMKGDVPEGWCFLNQTGQGVVQKPPEQLAALLTSGVLEIVGEGCAIDEAMNLIVTDIAAQLQQLSKGKAEFSPKRPQYSSVPDSTVKPCSAEEEKIEQKSISSAEPLELARDNIVEKSTVKGKPKVEISQSPFDISEVEPLSDEVMQTSLAAVDGLQIGARLLWYEKDEREFTLKLAVKTRDSKKLIFVNRIGMKVLDTDRHTLARLIASGRMVIIDIGTRFDSALERIVKHIQQDQQE